MMRQDIAICDGTFRNLSPLLIIAGAGSGKTNTLAHRVAHLIEARVAGRSRHVFHRRAVVRVLENRLPINPERSRHCKGRCAIGQALGDF